jgi:dTDP-4-dehydrorhamnose reductase
MKIAVLGAAGQLGAAMRAAAAERHDAIGLTRRDVDVTDAAALTQILTKAAPECIINCSAFAQVDEAEDAPLAALAVNAIAVRSLARISASLNATLVHYSTDFVFDGLTPGLHTEELAPNPSGVYASSKLLGEWFAADAPKRYVLRVESLFGGAAPKSSVDTLLDGILAGRTVTAFSDRSVSPSYVVDVAGATLAMVERQIPYGLYHCVNSGSTTWDQLTHELARLAHRPDAPIATARMADLKMRVRRPLHAALSNDKLRAAGIPMPSWQDALARHVAQRIARSRA